MLAQYYVCVCVCVCVRARAQKHTWLACNKLWCASRQCAECMCPTYWPWSLCRHPTLGAALVPLVSWRAAQWGTPGVSGPVLRALHVGDQVPPHGWGRQVASRRQTSAGPGPGPLGGSLG